MSGVMVGGAEPASVRFELLGPVRAVEPTGRPLELGSRRRRVLLAAPAAAPRIGAPGRPVGRPAVDRAGTGHRPMVHGAVAGLRRALGPAAALLAGALRERHARH